MPEISEGLTALMTTYAVRIAGVLAFILAAWIVAGWVRRLVAGAFNRANIDPTLTKFFSSFARYIVLIMAGLACLGAFGIETTSFAAVLGAAGLAIGLSLQGSLANFASGVMLLVFRPFKVGNVISVAGQTGRVDEIQIFVTRMITPDNRVLILPNGAVFGSTIENITTLESRRVDVDVGVDYSADIDETRRTLVRAASSIVLSLAGTEPQVVLTGLGASSVDWQIRVWCKTADYFTVREDLLRTVKLELDQARIGIPFPQMDVHVNASAAAVLSRAS